MNAGRSWWRGAAEISAGIGWALVIVGAVVLIGWMCGVAEVESVLSGLLLCGFSSLSLGAGLLVLLLRGGGSGWALGFLTTAGFVAGVVSLLAATGVSYRFTRQLRQTSLHAAGTQTALRHVDEIGRGTADLESSQRGYLLLGDEALLAERMQLSADVNHNLEALRTTAGVGRLADLNRLAALIEERNAFGERTIAMRRASGSEAAVALLGTGEGVRLSAQIQALLKKMETEEYASLADWLDKADVASAKAFIIIPLGALLSLTILMTGMFLLNRGQRGRTRAERRLAESFKEISDLRTALDEHAIVAITDRAGRIRFVNDKFCRISKYDRSELLGKDHRIINSGWHSKEFIRDLWTTISDGRVWHGELKNRAKDGSYYWVDTTIVPFLDGQGRPRQYVAIRTDITERKRVEAKVLQLNSELEGRVAKRTAQLEAANKELEAFSYSVSHDLRAPLRAIDGFSQALEEDYGAGLPEEGRGYLETIRSETQRMGNLIDDLLSFSRLSRAPLECLPMDTAALVRSVVRDLQTEYWERKIEVGIGELPPCDGDIALMKQVWINLLSNALKYTRKREKPVIEVGSRVSEGGETVYFVKDNGAGFDMRYVHKLFGVFQRLHRAEDYEGTGVGLAIVQRIIHRHGGRVWAEGAVNEGATFSFTLKHESSA